MTKKWINASIVVAMLSIFISPAIADAVEQKQNTVGSKKVRVFIVQSYEENHVCGSPQGRGIEAALKNEFNDGVHIETHYMNTKTINSTPDKKRKEARVVLKKIDSFDPDVVFTVDDDAFREVGLNLVGRTYPVIFTGMNGQPENYNRKVAFLDREKRPSANVTGVYEKLHFQTALNVMKGVIPDLAKIVALLDKSPTGNAIRVQLEKELAGYDEKMEVVFRQVGTMKDYLAEIERINSDPSLKAVYPVVLSVKDDKGVSVGFKTTLKAFVENSAKPGMALNFDFARSGLFGCASVDFGAMGRQAGILGIKALNGVDLVELPIESAQEYQITFNKKNADMLRIDIPSELIGAAIIYDSLAVVAQSE